MDLIKGFYKNYRVKMETGYIDTNLPQKQRPDFSVVINPKEPLWKFNLSIPGFTNTGFKKIIIFKIENEKKIEYWDGRAFTLFKHTHWTLPKEKTLQQGKKYLLVLKRV